MNNGLMQTSNQTNVFSIASLITGILSWAFALLSVFVTLLVSGSNYTKWILVPTVLTILCWAAAPITGYIGLRQIKKNHSQKGKGISVAGILMSVIGCLVFLLAAFALFMAILP